MKKRIEFIDAMRGFTIFTVMYSHILTFGFGANFMFESFSYDRIIVIFMLPMFFFISGIVSYKKDQNWDSKFVFKYLKDKFITLIIPTTIIMLVYIYVFNYDILSSFFDNAKKGYWFTFSLFEFFLIYAISCFLMQRLKLKNRIKNIFLIGSSLLILILSMPTVSLNYLKLDRDVFYLFSLSEMKYYVYFIMGILVRQYFLKYQQILDSKYFFATILASCICITIFFVKHGMYANGLINHAFLLILGVLWLTIIFAFFRKYENAFSKQYRFGRIIQFMGRRTLDIYLLHYFFLPRNMYFLRDFFLENNLPVIEFVIAISLASVVVAICLVVSQLLRTSDILAHYLFGVKLRSAKDTKNNNSEVGEIVLQPHIMEEKEIS